MLKALEGSMIYFLVHSYYDFSGTRINWNFLSYLYYYYVCTNLLRVHLTKKNYSYNLFYFYFILIYFHRIWKCDNFLLSCIIFLTCEIHIVMAIIFNCRKKFFHSCSWKKQAREILKAIIKDDFKQFLCLVHEPTK